jgi:hypothetical protein
VLAVQNTYIVTGTLTDDHTVTLDEALPLTRTKVRLVVEPISHEPRLSYQEVISSIRTRQRARDHHLRSREQVDAYLREERDSWGE